jgi:hypothetical protein
VAKIFTQIRPVDELETRSKTSKNEWLGPYDLFFIGEFSSAMSARALKKVFLFSYVEKRLLC